MAGAGGKPVNMPVTLIAVGIGPSKRITRDEAHHTTQIPAIFGANSVVVGVRSFSAVNGPSRV